MILIGRGLDLKRIELRPKGKLETGYTRCKQSGCAVFRVRKNPIQFPVTMAKGIHLFPYRTQKLSLSAPMVLGWRRPGRVGRCRIPLKERPAREGGSFFSYDRKVLFSGSSRPMCDIVLG